ncbi:hypothetical protein BKA80DRAFT_283588 [Phyllosticta citrichinensis]
MLIPRPSSQPSNASRHLQRPAPGLHHRSRRNEHTRWPTRQHHWCGRGFLASKTIQRHRHASHFFPKRQFPSWQHQDQMVLEALGSSE